MVQRPIEEWWSDVDPVIQHWFAENSGCLVLPRTVANTVHEVQAVILNRIGTGAWSYRRERCRS